MRQRRRGLAAVVVATAAAAMLTGPAVGSPGVARAGADVAEADSAAAVVGSPPMGWASWNSFAARINYGVIKAQTDALVSSGLKDAGYQYVNIDEGWWQGTRDAAGNITVDTNEWPGGMKAIADYIHGKGLKAGIYTDAGRDGCGYYYPTGRPAAPGSGSEGHYDQDFLQFSQWGFDFVKVDWCGGDAEGLDARGAYQAISDATARATARTGRPMVLSICDWGKQNPWDWAPGMATMWRTSGDIIFWGESPSMDRVLANFDAARHPGAQSAGHYNDPDMLVVGMPGFSAAQNRTHLSLWAISGAPLLAGNNLATMSTETANILANREVIAIDQDPAGRQGVRVAQDVSGQQVYSKVLAGSGRRAVVALNRTNATANITVRFADLGLASTATVRDVWSAADLGSRTTSHTVSVPARA
ncbi:glycoside hydrolase family 27 protein, partial [Actinophytocola sp.]|uniref:glycoside hydrolase family 27 protein n=1 Tax=Actinophytocola sp. TaxID=1872138 RepID=UPI00389AC4C2